jgi:4-diphosphocytidyl-2-C-methyl-D-erythritol kinase
MPRILTLRPPAKINLTLQVGPRNDDGFHDVRTILQSIALSDTLTFTAARGAFSLRTRSRGVAADRTNLIWRAAELLWRAAGRPGGPRDARVTLDKTIPIAAGLGGGSADAAAALVGLNRIWALGMPRHVLIRLASQLGSDVPFFLVGGAAIGTGRGADLLPLQDVARLGVVVIKPAFGVSTADAYRWFDEDRAGRAAASARARSEVLVGWPSGPIALVNDLEGPVGRRHPGVADAIDACLRAGAIGAAMTGSGSAVFGLFSVRATAQAARRLGRRDWVVLASRTLSRAESDRQMGL